MNSKARTLTRRANGITHNSAMSSWLPGTRFRDALMLASVLARLAHSKPALRLASKRSIAVATYLPDCVRPNGEIRFVSFYEKEAYRQSDTRAHTHSMRERDRKRQRERERKKEEEREKEREREREREEREREREREKEREEREREREREREMTQQRTPRARLS